MVKAANIFLWAGISNGKQLNDPTSHTEIAAIREACGKTKLSPTHFEGQYDLAEINQQTRRPIEIVHLADLENEALKVIQDWEATLA